jgi:hypothetical protein
VSTCGAPLSLQKKENMSTGPDDTWTEIGSKEIDLEEEIRRFLEEIRRFPRPYKVQSVEQDGKTRCHGSFLSQEEAKQFAEELWQPQPITVQIWEGEKIVAEIKT